MRLVAFSALGGFAAAHWGAFVTDPPVGRMLLVLAVATGGAAAARGARRARRSRAPAVHAAAAVIGVVDAGARPDGGRPARQAAPAGALGGARATGSTAASRGAQIVDWPYDGPRIRGSGSPSLLGAPALLTVGAVLAFWPARRGTHALRAAGLVALLLMYGTAVAERDPGQPALRGLVLLVLVGRLAVASAAPAPRSRSGRRGGGERRGSLAACRGRARHQPRVVGLPRREVVREAARSSRSTGTTPTAR